MRREPASLAGDMKPDCPEKEPGSSIIGFLVTISPLLGLGGPYGGPYWGVIDGHRTGWVFLAGIPQSPFVGPQVAVSKQPTSKLHIFFARGSPLTPGTCDSKTGNPGFVHAWLILFGGVSTFFVCGFITLERFSPV